MAEGDKEKLSTKNQGFQINVSEEHGNWLAVGEIIRSVWKPISIYVDVITKAFHKKLYNMLLVFGKCRSPVDCNKKTKPGDLCKPCQCWLRELKASHEKGNNPSWHKNCDSSRWPEDHWEVAKFFMPALGANRSTVKDAESTDLSSHLNVLEWMKDVAFLGTTRVNVDLVAKLRSQMRNTWAHAPKQELSDDEKNEDFAVANDFLNELEKVFPNEENGQCLKHLVHLKANGVTNVAESELQSLVLQHKLLLHIKEEIKRMNDDRSSDKSAIDEKLNKLECALNECSQRMSEFESLKEDINKQFNNFAEELKYFRSIPGNIREIRHDIGQIRNDLAEIIEERHSTRNEEWQPTSCLPEKLPTFTAREVEIQKVVYFLNDEGKAIVSLRGGPGFGKTAIAIEVSHKLSKDYNIPVVFSQLSTATTVDEMILRLCCDVGVKVDHEVNEEDRKAEFIFWLKNVKERIIFVMDDIDNLLEKRPRLYEFLRLLRKNSNQYCQIVTTSRISYIIPDLPTAKVDVDEMDNEACTKLLRKTCPEQDDDFLRKLAELCGNIPLAMCVAGSRVDDFENSDELLQHLENQPMQILKCSESDQYVYRAINLSYEMLDDKQKELFVRLAVFSGSFSEDAASAVIEKQDLDTKSILKNLVSRSLIKQPTKQRYSIHLLIKHFLNDQLKCMEGKAKKTHAEALMVEYYLDLWHDWTIKLYTRNLDASRGLMKEAQNILNVLKICCQQEDTISDCLLGSKIYTTSGIIFFLHAAAIIPEFLFENIIQRCANLAEERKQRAIKIHFDCISADRACITSHGKSEEYMEALEMQLKMHTKENKSISAHYCLVQGKFLLHKFHKGDELEKRLDFLNKAGERFEQAFELFTKLTETSEHSEAIRNFGKIRSLFYLRLWRKKVARLKR